MDRTPPRLGAHVSAAGGYSKALDRAVELGCDAAQIFVKSPNRWRGRTIPASEASAFRAQRAHLGLSFVGAHAAYLINLAATDPATRERSINALVEELVLCTRLGLDGLVLHPGAHLGAGARSGIRAVAKALDHVLSAAPPHAPPILLENTAGQGTYLGARLEQLARIIDSTAAGDRLGVCIDTCHAFAAGYVVHRPAGFERFVAALEATVGFARLGCLHVNDSRGGLGSAVDRHANIGEGRLGLASFHRLVNDPRFGSVPMLLETPLGPRRDGHRRDLEQLRALLGAHRARRLRTAGVSRRPAGS